MSRKNRGAGKKQKKAEEARQKMAARKKENAARKRAWMYDPRTRYSKEVRRKKTAMPGELLKAYFMENNKLLQYLSKPGSAYKHATSDKWFCDCGPKQRYLLDFHNFEERKNHCEKLIIYSGRPTGLWDVARKGRVSMKVRVDESGTLEEVVA
jgi:hypothetical protein